MSRERATGTRELLKLARVLGVESGDLGFLAGTPAADLEALREQISDALFAAHKHQFHKLAALSVAVPAPVAAKITEAAMTPLVSARTAELLHPERAVDMIKRLSFDYVTEIATHLDARRAAAVLVALPAEQVAGIATQLAARGEWVVMGALMSYVNEQSMAASVHELSAEQLLRIGFVVDDTDAIAALVDNLDDEKVHGLLQATVDEQLWAESEFLLGALRPDQRERIRTLLEDAPPHVVQGYTAARERGDLTAI